MNLDDFVAHFRSSNERLEEAIATAQRQRDWWFVYKRWSTVLQEWQVDEQAITAHAQCPYCGTFGALGRCASCGAPNAPREMKAGARPVAHPMRHVK